MKCPKCQHLNDSAAKFCAECASPLAWTCVSCGNPLPPTAKFCPECAHPTGLATATQLPFLSPSAYTPTHLAAKILNSRAAIEGERKQVTVLFADLKGSTELLADRDPEEARNLLEPILKLMMEAVHHYEGTVNQAAGDGIMALFGAPVAHEDHATRACYAALRMQEQVKRHAEGALHTFGVNLQIRVGLNSGEVVVGAIGSDLRMDYTAVGRTTHLAARMEQHANPGSILVTPSTLELVDGFVTVKSLGPVTIKGLIEPLEVHEVTGVGPVRTRLQAVARRGLTRFVGREAELEQLRRVQQLADAGNGQAVALMAEAGLGKSRLVYEFAHSPDLEGWLVLECHAVSYGKAMSYLPVINLLQSYFEVSERDNPQAITDKVEAKLLALEHSLAHTLPTLLALLNVPVKDATWQKLDPAQRRRRMLDGVRHLLLREAQRRPLLLIFEDLHWIDNETQAVLDGLVEDLGSARILLLATFRPEYQHGWAGKNYYSQLRLDALAGESGSQLLDALLGDDPTLQSLKQLLVNHGNPFFLEETVRTLLETKALEGSSGSYRLTRPIEAIQVPARVQVILASRIDRLSLEDKHLLQIAAVIGRRVPFSLLRAVADLPDDALRSGLDRLQAAEFVYETGLFPDLEYSFKHAITQEVAYGGILQERRRNLHARIVEAIETLHHNRLDEQVELLAHHALRGDLREKAVGYLRRAGIRAGARSARQDAVAWYDQALRVLDSLPQSEPVLTQGFDIRLEVRHMQVQLGDFHGALQRLSEAEGLAEKLNDDHRRGQACVFQMSMHATVGQMEEALALGTRALAIARRLGDLRFQILTTTYLEQAYSFRGDHQRVVELAAANLAALPANSVYDHFGTAMPVSIFDRCWQFRSLAELGRFAEATECAAETIRLAQPTQRVYTDGHVHQNAALIYLLHGDWRKALALIEHAIETYRTGNFGLFLPIVVAYSAWAQAQLNEAGEALDRLREAERLVERIEVRDTVSHFGWVYLSMGRACLLLGQLDAAKHLGRRVVESFSSRFGYVAHALLLLADIATHRDQFDGRRRRERERETETERLSLGE